MEAGWISDMCKLHLLAVLRPNASLDCGKASLSGLFVRDVFFYFFLFLERVQRIANGLILFM